MKIAVQIFGHLRTFEQCAPKLRENILDLYNCDVFIHSWDTLEHQTQTWHNAKDSKAISHKIDEDIINKIHSLYNPKKLLIESQDVVEEQGYYGAETEKQISLKGIKSMLYSLYQTNELRSAYQLHNNIEYDYVIVMRPDILLIDPLSINNYSNEFSFDDNTSIHFLFSLGLGNVKDKLYNYAGAMDVFFFSIPKNIDIISQCYLNFDKYFKIFPSMVFGNSISHPEVAFQEYIYRQGIVPRTFKYNFIIKRKNSKNDICPWGNNNIFNKSMKNLITLVMQGVREIVPLFLRRIIRRFLNFTIKWLSLVERLCV